jgi:23S rRNA (adenine2503-C2)-methyltransferase
MNLIEILKDEPKFRYKQINKALYQDFISDWNELSVLPIKLREELNKKFSLSLDHQLFKEEKSARALIKFEDTHSIETVLIRNNNLNTVCLSSQIGCPLKCRFCASGNVPFIRNLSADEIIWQFLFWARYLKTQQEKIERVVFMGMGEPFLNYDEFKKALDILNSSEKINLGARKISVSTVGILSGIKKLASEKAQINLAISLHASNDILRKQLMPLASSQANLYQLFKAVDDYIKKSNRQVMLEYLMINNVNDSLADAYQLAKLIKGKKLYIINLIPLNKVNNYNSSSHKTIEHFKSTLESEGIRVTVRESLGYGLEAACGQLSLKSNN